MSKSFHCDFCESRGSIPHDEGLSFRFDHTMDGRGRFELCDVHIGMEDFPDAPKTMYMCKCCDQKVNKAKEDNELNIGKTD